MSDLSLLIKYFPHLTDHQIEQYKELDPLYVEWNEKINLVSRKDIEHIYLRHILHSLAIAKYISFPAGTRVLDVGTGGGFPGIPLAIMYPDVNFTLVDSIGKKINVVKEISKKIKCTNIQAIHSRVEDLNSKFDYIVSRAVTNMPKFVEWVEPRIRRNKHRKPPSGIIALKGGDLKEELGKMYSRSEIVHISSYFEEDFFSSKMIVFLSVK